MLLRTFSAPDMPTAIKMMRESLGDNAIILSTEANKGTKGITVTAAVEKDDDEPYIPATAKKSAQQPPTTSLDQLRFEIQNVLRFHNVPELYVAKMLRKTPDREFSSMVELLKISAKGDTKKLLAVTMEKFFG